MMFVNYSNIAYTIFQMSIYSIRVFATAFIQEAQACHEIKLQKLKDDWKQNQITNKDHR